MDIGRYERRHILVGTVFNLIRRASESKPNMCRQGGLQADEINISPLWYLACASNELNASKDH